MESQEIATYLQALNEELASRTIGKPVRLVVVGGVYMVSIIKNRSSTKDVDVVPLSFPDTMNADRETKAFRSAVNAVAKRCGLKRDWLNDVVAAFVPAIGSIELWQSYTHLEVYIPSASYVLALKLLAGRAKDEDDITALCALLHIETRQQAQTLVNQYADQRWQNECNLVETLDSLFD